MNIYIYITLVILHHVKVVLIVTNSIASSECQYLLLKTQFMSQSKIKSKNRTCDNSQLSHFGGSPLFTFRIHQQFLFL